MAENFWSNVTVKMASAFATPIALTGITKADPGEASHAGSDPSDGDYVLITADGMISVDDRVFRVDNQAAGTFELEAEDTTNYEVFTAGTFSVITFGHNFGTFREVNASGGEANFEDTSTIHTSQQTQAPVSQTPFTIQFTSKWDVADSALVAAKVYSDAKTQTAFMVQFATGQRMLCYGYINTGLIPGGSAQGLVTTPVTLTVSTAITTYTT